MEELLVVSVILNIVQDAIIISDYVKSLDKRNNELLSKQKTISIPIAEDAEFIRKQVRNPSWSYVYDTINRAIRNGEDHCEIIFYHDDPKIPEKELIDELSNTYNYRVERHLGSCDTWFDVYWG